jgi:hypothetical protein
MNVFEWDSIDLIAHVLDNAETQGTYTEEDLCFAMTDFLIHNNRDAFKSMLALLKSLSFERYQIICYDGSKLFT